MKPFNSDFGASGAFYFCLINFDLQAEQGEIQKEAQKLEAKSHENVKDVIRELDPDRRVLRETLGEA